MASRLNTHGGIWPGSTSDAYQSWAIFSLAFDRECTFKAWMAMAQIGFKPLFGFYKGKVERSYIVNAAELARLQQWFAGEESILLLGPLFRDGVLHGDHVATSRMLATEEHIELGLFGEVPHAQALRQDGWTYDPAGDDWYAITSPMTIDVAGEQRARDKLR